MQGPSCPVTCGIFPDQRSNLCPLHWQAASYPLCHHVSFSFFFFFFFKAMKRSRPWYKFLVKANEWKYSKKWHFTRKLPESGAVVVKRGQRPVLSPHRLITSTPQDSITSCGWLSDPQQTVWITLCTLALVTQQVQTAGFLAVHPLPRYYSS